MTQQLFTFKRDPLLKSENTVLCRNWRVDNIPREFSFLVCKEVDRQHLIKMVTCESQLRIKMGAILFTYVYPLLLLLLLFLNCEFSVLFRNHTCHFVFLQLLLAEKLSSKRTAAGRIQGPEGVKPTLERRGMYLRGASPPHPWETSDRAPLGKAQKKLWCLHLEPEQSYLLSTLRGRVSQTPSVAWNPKLTSHPPVSFPPASRAPPSIWSSGR